MKPMKSFRRHITYCGVLLFTVGGVVLPAQTSRDSSRATTRDTSRMSRSGGDSSSAVVDLLTVASRDEIEASRFAMGKATRPEVKAYAQRMIDDHTKALKMLEDSSSSGGWMKSDSMRWTGGHADSMKKDMAGNDAASIHAANMAAMKQLREVNAANFDQTYMTTQVDGHQKLLTALDRHTTSNTKLGGMVTDMKATIRKHLEDGRKIQSSSAPSRP